MRTDINHADDKCRFNESARYFFFSIGVHFDTSSESLVSEIATAIKVYAYGVEDFVNDPSNANRSLNTQLSCEGAGESRWSTGDLFFK